MGEYRDFGLRHPPGSDGRLAREPERATDFDAYETSYEDDLADLVARLRGNEEALLALIRAQPVIHRLDVRIACTKILGAKEVLRLIERVHGPGWANFSHEEEALQPLYPLMYRPSTCLTVNHHRAAAAHELIVGVDRSVGESARDTLHEYYRDLPASIRTGVYAIAMNRPQSFAVVRPAAMKGVKMSERAAASLALAPAAERRAVTLYRRALESHPGTPDEAPEKTIDEALANSHAGAPLPAELRERLEARLGVSFSAVRIHDDQIAHRAAKAAGARAFTIGEDIFFAAGAFAPSTTEGQELLVHELTHVVQSYEGRVWRPSVGIVFSQPGDALEREADAKAKEHRTTAAATPAVTSAVAQSPQRAATGVAVHRADNTAAPKPGDQPRDRDFQINDLYAFLRQHWSAETEELYATATPADLRAFVEAQHRPSLPSTRWGKGVVTDKQIADAKQFIAEWKQWYQARPHAAAPRRLADKIGGKLVYGDEQGNWGSVTKRSTFYPGEYLQIRLEWEQTASHRYWWPKLLGTITCRWEIVFAGGSKQLAGDAVAPNQVFTRLDVPPGPVTVNCIVTAGDGDDNRMIVSGAKINVVDKAQFEKSAVDDALTKPDENQNAAPFVRDKDNRLTVSQGAKAPTMTEERLTNAATMGALQALNEKDKSKVSDADLRKAKEYFGARNQALAQAEQELTGKPYLVRGAFVGSENAIQLPIKAYLSKPSAGNGAYKVLLLDTTLNPKTPTHHPGEGALRGSDQQARTNAEGEALHAMVAHWHSNNDYPSGKIQLAIASLETPGKVWELTLDTGNWKKPAQKILGVGAAAVGGAALLFGQAEITVPMMYIASAMGLGSVALDIEHRARQEGTLKIDGRLGMDILQVVAILGGAGASKVVASKAFSAGAKTMYLYGLAGVDVTQAIAIGASAKGELDGARSRYLAAFAKATTDEQRADAERVYQEEVAQVAGHALMNEAMISVSLAASAKGIQEHARTRPPSPAKTGTTRPPDTVDMFCVGEVPKTGPARRKYIEDPAVWTPERRALHDVLIAEAKPRAQSFADAAQRGEPTIYATRGNTAVGKSRALKGNIPELAEPMSKAKDSAVNPDNFKQRLMTDGGRNLTSTDVHMESSILATRLERELAGLRTSDGKELGSIMVDKRLATVADVMHYAQMAKSTGRKFKLYDVDAPLETSLTGVLERAPGDPDPLPSYGVVGDGYIAVRRNRQAVIDQFLADPSFGTYELYVTQANGNRVKVAEVKDAKLHVFEQKAYAEVTQKPSEGVAALMAEKRITEELIRDLTAHLPADRAQIVGKTLRKYLGRTWKEALDIHSAEKAVKADQQ